VRAAGGDGVKDDTWLLILLLSILGAAFLIGCAVALWEYLVDQATIVRPSRSAVAP
jgi:hypothetical protein